MPSSGADWLHAATLSEGFELSFELLSLRQPPHPLHHHAVLELANVPRPRRPERIRSLTVTLTLCPHTVIEVVVLVHGCSFPASDPFLPEPEKSIMKN